MSPTTPDVGEIRGRFEDASRRIDDAARRVGRDPVGVRVVAVTKGFPAEVVAAAVRAGIPAVGENRAQELLEKVPRLPDDVAPEWHFVGRIQRNKVKKLAPLVTVWHGVDRLAAGEEVARRAPGARVHVQVDVAGEATKAGCAPSEARDLVGALADLGLRVEGLMTVPPLDEDPRPHFARLAELAADAEVAGLSMGMSGDFEVAVEEGATVVRLGTTLFGPRPESH